VRRGSGGNGTRKSGNTKEQMTLGRSMAADKVLVLCRIHFHLAFCGKYTRKITKSRKRTLQMISKTMT